MALHFTLIGKDELSIHFDVDGLGELLKGVEGAIRAAKAQGGGADGAAVESSGGSPGSVAKVTLTLLDPPPPTTH